MDTDNQAKNQSQEVKAEESTPKEKTFTQADVNRIVADRVSDFSDYEELKAKAAKYDEAEEANKSELQKAQEENESLKKELNALKSANEIQKVHEKISQETGVPASLLTAKTEDECRTQAENIKAYAKPEYPKVADAGETTHVSKKTTREQFKEWVDQM